MAAEHRAGRHEYNIVLGKPNKMILLYRMRSKDPCVRMPSVGRNMVPTEAVAFIEKRIAAMSKEQ